MLDGQKKKLLIYLLINLENNDRAIRSFTLVLRNYYIHLLYMKYFSQTLFFPWMNSKIIHYQIKMNHYNKNFSSQLF